MPGDATLFTPFECGIKEGAHGDEPVSLHARVFRHSGVTQTGDAEYHEPAVKMKHADNEWNG